MVFRNSKIFFAVYHYYLFLQSTSFNKERIRVGYLYTWIQTWSDMNKDDLFRLITKHCCEVIPALSNHSFHLDDQLKVLGANSLDRSEIIDMTMDSLSLEIPRVELFGAATIGELVDVFHGKQAP